MVSSINDMDPWRMVPEGNDDFFCKNHAPFDPKNK